MRLHRANLGDFVPGRFALPQNPVSATRGMGDLVPGAFALPQNPVVMRKNGMGEFVPAFWQVPSEFVPAAWNIPPVPVEVGLGGCGCGCGGSCGGPGLGQIDWSISGVGIVDAIGGAFGAQTANIPQIPNWIFYIVGAGVAYMAFFESKPRYRRNR